MKRFTDIYRELLKRNAIMESAEYGMYLVTMIDDPTYFINDQMTYEQFKSWIIRTDANFFRKYDIAYDEDSLDDEYGTMIICARIANDDELQKFLDSSCHWSSELRTNDNKSMTIRRYMNLPETSVTLDYMKANGLSNAEEINDVGQYAMLSQAPDWYSYTPPQNNELTKFGKYINDEMHKVYFYLDDTDIKKRLVFMAPDLDDEKYERDDSFDEFREKYHLKFNRKDKSGLCQYWLEFNSADQLKEILAFEILPNVTFARLLHNDIVAEAVKRNAVDVVDDESDEAYENNENDKNDENDDDDESNWDFGNNESDNQDGRDIEDDLLDSEDFEDYKIDTNDDEVEKYNEREKERTAKKNKPNYIEKCVNDSPENELITRIAWASKGINPDVKGSFVIMDVE